MTKTQAIKILTQQKNEFLDTYIDYAGVAKAYDMAIELLKREELNDEKTKIRSCS